MDHWLAEPYLFVAEMSESERLRRYKVFLEVQFGDCARANPTEYFAELVELE